KDDFEAFGNRDLSGIDLDYLFLDGSHFKMHDGTGAEPVLVAYGITTVGQPVLIAVEPAATESTDAWAGFLADQHTTAFPAAVRCLQDDRQALTSFLRFPPEHWKRIRHTNLIERTFGETRRRVKVIGRMPGEASCLALVWAVLDRASTGWPGLRYTPAITRHLTNIGHQLNRPTTTKEDPTTTPGDAATAAA
ncbi:MAG: hypothetical protein GY953_09660, partial [bacterium]|nr:hypothetical protein [bacterium]